MEDDGDFDLLGDLRRREEDRCLVKYGGPHREVMPMLTGSELLNKIMSYDTPKPNCKLNVTNLAHPSRCILKI